jgi:site-specific DNA recombinase
VWVRVAVYARVSSDEQTERQTIIGQRHYAEAYLQQHGLSAVFYEDQGWSGTIPVAKRPAGARLLQDAEARRFDLLLVYRVDRLARSLLELLRCVETLHGFGVSLRSMSEPFDTSSALGRAFLQLLGIFAELERNSILERTALGKKRRAAEGLWQGGPPPYGYRIVAGRLQEEPAEAIVIQELFTLSTQGYTTQALATLLNARGLPNPTHARATRYKNAGVWIYTTIGAILRNPVYRGEARFRGAVLPCPPLVSPEAWEATQAALTSRRHVPQGRLRLYLLTGLLRCALCGSAAGGTTATSRGRRFHYYRCSRERRTGPSCAAPHMPAEKLEAQLWETARQALLDPSFALGHLRTELLSRREEPPPAGELEALEKAETEKQVERARIIGYLRRGVITEAEGERELETLREEVEALRGRAGLLRAAWVTDAEIEERVSGLERLLRELVAAAETSDPGARRLVLSRLLTRCMIGKGVYAAEWVWDVSE